MMTCKICIHPERKAIDRALVENRSLRDVAGQYSTSRSALDRHKKHIPKALTVAKQAETVAETTTLLSRVEKLAARCETMIEKAEVLGDWRGAAGAARELRGCLELLGKLNGQLQANGARVAINFGDITKIDIHALTEAQLEALYERISADQQARHRAMSTEEISARLGELVLDGYAAIPPLRETILFDEVTVPPGPGYEANMRHQEAETGRRATQGLPPLEKNPWRRATSEDRYKMLAAAWRRETGEDLDVTGQELGGRAVIELCFDFEDERDWLAWPKVKLRL